MTPKQVARLRAGDWIRYSGRSGHDHDAKVLSNVLELVRLEWEDDTLIPYTTTFSYTHPIWERVERHPDYPDLEDEIVKVKVVETDWAHGDGATRTKGDGES